MLTVQHPAEGNMLIRIKQGQCCGSVWPICCSPACCWYGTPTALAEREGRLSLLVGNSSVQPCYASMYVSRLSWLQKESKQSPGL